jgi:hypothetical protein
LLALLVSFAVFEALARRDSDGSNSSARDTPFQILNGGVQFLVAFIEELRSHKIGVLRGPSAGKADNQLLLDTVLAQYDVPVNTVQRVFLTASEVSRALVDKEIDALLAVGVSGSDGLAEAINAVATAGGGQPIFLPIVRIMTKSFGAASLPPPVLTANLLLSARQKSSRFCALKSARTSSVNPVGLTAGSLPPGVGFDAEVAALSQRTGCDCLPAILRPPALW